MNQPPNSLFAGSPGPSWLISPKIPCHTIFNCICGTLRSMCYPTSVYNTLAVAADQMFKFYQSFMGVKYSSHEIRVDISSVEIILADLCTFSSVCLFFYDQYNCESLSGIIHDLN